MRTFNLEITVSTCISTMTAIDVQCLKCGKLSWRKTSQFQVVQDLIDIDVFHPPLPRFRFQNMLPKASGESGRVRAGEAQWGRATSASRPWASVGTVSVCMYLCVMVSVRTSSQFKANDYL